MGFGIRDFLYITGVLITGVTTFFVTKHGLKDYIRDRIDSINNEIGNLKLENEKLKSKIDLQSSTIDQFKKQILDHLPEFYKIIANKK